MGQYFGTSQNIIEDKQTETEGVFTFDHLVMNNVIIK